jgi:hypothetical protein
MSNTEDEKAREEKALDALIAAACKDDPTEADDKGIERYGNALTDDDRKKLDDAGILKWKAIPCVREWLAPS